MRALWLSVLLAGVGACVGASGPPIDNESLHEYWFRTGPYAGVDESRGGLYCRIFHPINMDYDRHPVIVWGNGRNTSPAAYRDLLEHWASHGFVVVAAMTPNAESGREMSRCLEYVLNQNAVRRSPFQGRLRMTRIGVAGHSLGGAGALVLGRDPRITTVVALQPFIAGAGSTPNAATGQRGPLLLLSGTEDTTASPAEHQRPVFEQLEVPVTWLTLDGASHLAPMYDGGSYRGVMTAWFRMQLMDDEQAARMFNVPDCVLCQDERWTMRSK